MASISKITLPDGSSYDIKATYDSGGNTISTTYLKSSEKGAASGVAPLNSSGIIDTQYLPSYVDDVLEYLAKSSFPSTGETGKIYVDTTTNLTYRWSGSAYVEISPSLALGETSSTAYRGDRGKTAYTHATDSSRLTTATSSGLYKVAATAQGHIASLTAVTKDDITGLGIPGSDTNTTYSAGTGLSLSGTTFNHSNSVTAGTVGTSSGTSGSTLAVPYITYDGQGHITATGTHTHTVSGFLTSHQTIKQDGITGATVNRFGKCTVASGTAAKTVSITSGTFSLEAGAMVTVKFDNANTANNPTLNVNSKGAKNIFQNGAQIASGSNKELLKGVCTFIYDGTQWHLIGNYIDNGGGSGTTYIASTDTIGSASAGTAISADDITSWNGGTAASASASQGVVTFTNGTKPTLEYTARSIPNISVTNKTVVTGISASDELLAGFLYYDESTGTLTSE